MPEDILQGNKSEVDSTTDIDSPIKKRKVTQSKPKRKRAKSAVSAHIQAAKKRKYDQLANMELTSKDMLQGDESEVDSTTDIDSPVKKRKVTQNKSTPKQGKSALSARIQAAKKRAAEIFSSTPGGSDNEVARLRQQVQDLERKLASPPQGQPSSKLPHKIQYCLRYTHACICVCMVALSPGLPLDSTLRFQVVNRGRRGKFVTSGQHRWH